MSAKIINSRRYKTITKTELEKKRRLSNSHKAGAKSKVKKSNKNTTSDNSQYISNVRIKKHRERQLEREMLLYSRPQRTVIKEPKQKIYIPKSFVIFCLVLALVIIVYASAKIMNLDEKIAISVFNDTDSNDTEAVELEANYDLKIALTGLDTANVYLSTNLILNDLYKETSFSLINVYDNYEIEYSVARAITKVSNSEYIIQLNTAYKLDYEDIKYSIEKILSAGQSNMYYSRLSDIKEITDEGDNRIKITLNNDDPYFVYYLDFPIVDNDGKVLSDLYYSQVSDSTATFNSSLTSELTNLNSITITNYSSVSDCVNAFVNGEIDVFFATSNNDMQLIGKNDYNVKKYKDGEMLIIFGNKNSTIFSKNEIRTALMYSIDRDSIIKNSDNNFIETIDLPFLYSSVKYKYDIVGAKNILESNGWSANYYGIYEKTDESGNYLSATLRLLVNSTDSDKITVAENIKSMALNAGINIEIEALTSEEIEQRVAAGDYDIVLATVYVNETPDVSFLEEYLNINDETNQAFEQVENSSCEDLVANIQNLEYVLSDQVACIGIYARNINLIYQKYIYGFNDINYMTIFNDLENIGKIIE